MIENVEQLDELMTRPSAADVDAMRTLEGDLILLGVAGKMGPSLAIRARRAVEQAGVRKRIIGVSRFSSPDSRGELEDAGVETIAADVLERDHVSGLPDCENVIYLVGRKFGSTGQEHLTWAMNALAPALVAERYAGSRIVAFSSGNIYPFLPAYTGGATEDTPVGPVGEYAQSVLGRERMFEYFSHRNHTPMTILRLNYAVDLRYGVLLDIGARVFGREPVDVRQGAVNVIWQGDANSVCLRSFGLCSVPPAILNLTGPETASVRYIAERFGFYFGVQPSFEGEESGNALLNNAVRCHRQFGYPSIPLEQLIEWTARWIGMGGTTLGKPTHFEARDGKY